jgi:hypothetical protein
MSMLTVEQELREWLTENAWRFQHEGTHVVRWLTGGTAPDASVTFERQGDEIMARCPSCRELLGQFDASYGSAVYRQIAAIRQIYARHQC